MRESSTLSRSGLLASKAPGRASQDGDPAHARNRCVAKGWRMWLADYSPLGNRPWRRGELFSESSHERSFLKRTDQEPPHPTWRRAERLPDRHGQEIRLHASASPRSRACPGRRSGLADHPSRNRGSDDRTPWVATATGSEPWGHLSTRHVPHPSLVTVEPWHRRR